MGDADEPGDADEFTAAVELGCCGVMVADGTAAGGGAAGAGWSCLQPVNSVVRSKPAKHFLR